MAIELGRIQFDESRLFKQLRNDFKDDWFPDPLGYGDMLDSGLVTKIINKNFEANHGQYVPSDRVILNVPKPNFTLRYALETSLSDRVIYHGLTAFLVPFFDKLIPWNVFSHRYNYHRPSERYIFRRGVQSWQEFVGVVQSSLDGANVLLSTDIANYFENISLSRLKRNLLEMIPDMETTGTEKSDIRAHIDMLFNCLKAWAFEPDRGLPQNRDASSFLANIYMRYVDEAMLSAEFVYYRYMDDIKVVCSNEFDARRALKRLSLLLRDIGLTINAKKTEIVSAADARDKGLIDEGSAEIQHLDEIFRSRSRVAILRALPELKSFFHRLISEKNTDSREFRFCIKRLELLARYDDIYVPPDMYSGITPEVIKAISEHPASTDQYFHYLLAVPLAQEHLHEIALYLQDKDKSIYGWQNYRLWTLLAQKGYRDAEHIKFAVESIIEQPDSPTRAGATAYIGVVGGDDDRIEVARNFRSLKTFLGQRTALISIQELRHRDIIDNVRPYLRDDLLEVYRNLHTKNNGQYFVPLEKLSISDINDLGGEYV